MGTQRIQMKGVVSWLVGWAFPAGAREFLFCLGCSSLFRHPPQSALTAGSSTCLSTLWVSILPGSEACTHKNTQYMYESLPLPILLMGQCPPIPDSYKVFYYDLFSTDAMEETGRQSACEYSWWGQVQLDSGTGRIGLLYRPCSARDWDGKDYLRIIPRVVW
jgi:hypothetical protein